MTPKEKAEELVYKYSELGIGHPTSLSLPKQCALIAVDEVLGYMGADRGYEFWTEVKKEIEKL
jgi:hypothetical protein